MRSNWILTTVLALLFINIFILYFLIYNLFVAVGKIPVSDSSILLPGMAETENANAEQEKTGLQTDTAESKDAQPKDEQCALCEDKIAQLTSSLEAVNIKIDAMKSEAGQSVAAPQKPAVFELSNSVREVTIPFGSGQTSSKEWEDIPGMNAYIDSTNYTQVSSIHFEAVLRIPTAVGYVHTRLFNASDGHPVWNSELVSETNAPIIKTSGPIVIDGGNNLYQVQMKSTIGHLTIIDSGRIKIYFK